MTGSVLHEAMALVQYELLLFAAVFFAIGLADELAVDAVYGWLRLTGRGKTAVAPPEMNEAGALEGPAAVFLPAWQEDAVIALTLRHALRAWPQAAVTIYVGCYRNDPATIAAVERVARGDRRVRLVVVEAEGPTCKAHCLNVLYRALAADERGSGVCARMVVLHDAEDMVDPAELALLDRAVAEAAFVQLPVLALPRPGARWIGGHYTDEFAEPPQSDDGGPRCAGRRDPRCRRRLRGFAPDARAACHRPGWAPVCRRFADRGLRIIST